MVVFGLQKTADATRRFLETTTGVSYYKSEWMESGQDSKLSPTIFMVEQMPYTVIAPHFHRQNQFQLFVEGAGTIGKSDLEAVTVHYAGAYTGYGPLQAGPLGIKYFTIRPVYESGALFVKESREEFKPGPKRHATSSRHKVASAGQLSALEETVREELIAQTADGLGAQAVMAPPGSSIPTDFPAASQGVFAVVLAGAVKHSKGSLRARESVFASSEEDFPQLTAGEEGADLVFLSVPFKALAYLEQEAV